MLVRARHAAAAAAAAATPQNPGSRRHPCQPPHSTFLNKQTTAVITAREAPTDSEVEVTAPAVLTQNRRCPS